MYIIFHRLWTERPKKGNYRCDIYLQNSLSYRAETWGEHCYYRYILAMAESS